MKGAGSSPWVHAPEGIDWTSPDTWAALESVGRSVAADCLARPDVPDALYCLAESFAVGVLAEAAARGIRVPEDI